MEWILTTATVEPVNIVHKDINCFSMLTIVWGESLGTLDVENKVSGPRYQHPRTQNMDLWSHWGHCGKYLCGNLTSDFLPILYFRSRKLWSRMRSWKYLQNNLWRELMGRTRRNHSCWNGSNTETTVRRLKTKVRQWSTNNAHVWLSMSEASFNKLCFCVRCNINKFIFLHKMSTAEIQSNY